MPKKRKNASGRPRVAVVGRPNVGKSTLFNRLVGRREAIVHDRPGVTRDRLERPARLATRLVTLEDTGGILPDAEEEIFREVTRQALVATTTADLIVFVIDARAGVTTLDEAIAEELRRAPTPVLLAVNKVDVTRLEADAGEGWRLGLGEPWPVSAEHGLGIDDLIEAIEAALPKASGAELAALAQEEGEAARESDFPEPPREGEPLSVAIVGRPNVGKSSLVNRLVGEARVTVSSVPGTTRDAIDVEVVRDGRPYLLVDTAGIRRRAKVATHDEGIGIMLTRRRLKRAHAAVVVLDANEGVTSLDQAVVGDVVDSGRPFLLAFNKWDLVDKPEARIRELEGLVARKLPFARTAPWVTISALSGQRAPKVLEGLAPLVELASRRVPTAELNRFLRGSLDEHLAGGGTAPKAFYITQTGVLPPRFVVFCRHPEKISAPFRRFLERKLRESFGLEQVPVRIYLRASPRRD